MLLLAAVACSPGRPAQPAPSAVASAPSIEASPTPAVTAGASPSATTSPGPAVPFCATTQLRLSVEESDAGAGQFHQHLILTNRGARCSLHGYPGVSFVDAQGRLLGNPAAQSPAPVRRVFLDSGAAASAVLTYSNAGAFPDSSCRPQHADRVRVYPPGQRAALLAADPILVCSAPGSGQLHVGPLGPSTD